MKLIYVKWADSCSPANSGWRGIDRKREEPLFCESIGWLVHESDKVIVLAGHRALGHDDGSVNEVCGEMTIPKVAIVKRRKVKI